MIKIEEEWRKIDGYPQYLISNYGNVYSRNVNRILKQSTTRKENGYRLVWLTKNNHTKGFLVHRLVYETFVGEIPDGLQINHIDENKFNNHLDNLEIVTPRENLLYGNGMKRRIETLHKKYPDWSSNLRKPCINETTNIAYISVSEAAKLTNGKVGSISNACTKKRKTYRKEVWSYLERR